MHRVTVFEGINLLEVTKVKLHNIGKIEWQVEQ